MFTTDMAEHVVKALNAYEAKSVWYTRWCEFCMTATNRVRRCCCDEGVKADRR